MALEHAVGDDDEPVAGLQHPRRDPVGGVGEEPEREVDLEVDHADHPGPVEGGAGVPGVDEFEPAGAEINPAEQPGDGAFVGAAPGVLGQRRVGCRGLFEQPDPAPAGVAPASGAGRRGEGTGDPVAHLLGDRPKELVAVHAVVAGVPPLASVGASQAERVNSPAAPGNAAGSSRRWISAGRLNSVLRCPHSNKSVCRRFAITTHPSACALRPISARTPGSGSSGRDISSSPSASPRSVTGARPVQAAPTGRPREGDVGASTRTVWVRMARSAWPPSNGRMVTGRSPAGDRPPAEVAPRPVFPRGVTPAPWPARAPAAPASRAAAGGGPGPSVRR